MEKSARRKPSEVAASPRRGQAQVPTKVTKMKNRLSPSAEKESKRRDIDSRSTSATLSKTKTVETSKTKKSGDAATASKVDSSKSKSETKASAKRKGDAEVKKDSSPTEKKGDAKTSGKDGKGKKAELTKKDDAKGKKLDTMSLKDAKKVEIGFLKSTIPNLPPGVYFDDKTIGRSEPTFPIDAEKPLLAAGPFGIGEAKACLDDLQATLLNYYGKLYRIEPSMPLDWQIEQLRRSYYPSPAPISGHVDRAGLAVDLGQLAGALPPPFPNGLSNMTPDGKFANVSPDTHQYDNVTFMRGTPADKRDEAKAKIQSSIPVDAAKVKEGAPAEKNAEAVKTKETGREAAASKGVSKKQTLDVAKRKETETADNSKGAVREKSLTFGISGVIGDLHELAEKNMLGINKLEKEIDAEIGDPTSLYYWRGDAMPRGVRKPVYYSNRNERGHMNEQN